MFNQTINNLTYNLSECSTIINQTDEKMLALRKIIDETEDIEDEFEIIKDKMKRIDEPLL